MISVSLPCWTSVRSAQGRDIAELPQVDLVEPGGKVGDRVLHVRRSRRRREHELVLAAAAREYVRNGRLRKSRPCRPCPAAQRWGLLPVSLKTKFTVSVAPKLSVTVTRDVAGGTAR